MKFFTNMVFNKLSDIIIKKNHHSTSYFTLYAFYIFLVAEDSNYNKISFHVFYNIQTKKRKVTLNFTIADVCPEPLEQESNLTSVPVNK